MIFGITKIIMLKPKYKTISFDIFDTLVERKQLSPLDIFLEIGQKVLGGEKATKFCLDRIEAEKVARTQKESGETTLNEIYTHLRCLYAEEFELLKEAEEEYEIDSCHRRDDIYQLFQEAKENGKRIIIVSDMYLSREVIECILQKCGYDSYDALFISNEENSSKRNGKLYDVVLKKDNISGGSILHIGDSIKADYFSARKHGIKALLIPRKSAIRRKLHEKSIRG